MLVITTSNYLWQLQQGGRNIVIARVAQKQTKPRKIVKNLRFLRRILVSNYMAGTNL